MRLTNLNKSDLEQFIKERSWTRPDSYMGPDHCDTIYVYGQNRDSDLLTQSNFAAALERLGGESKTVEVIRDSHWACGWVEAIRVSVKDKKRIKVAFEIFKELEAYPVLDEDDFSEREDEERGKYCTWSQGSVSKVLSKLINREDLAENEDMINLAYRMQYEFMCQNGNDSCLYDNEYHIDNMRDRDKDEYAEAFRGCLSDKHHYEYNELERVVAAHFNIKLK